MQSEPEFTFCTIQLVLHEVSVSQNRFLNAIVVGKKLRKHKMSLANYIFQCHLVQKSMMFMDIRKSNSFPASFCGRRFHFTTISIVVNHVQLLAISLQQVNRSSHESLMSLQISHPSQSLYSSLQQKIAINALCKSRNSNYIRNFEMEMATKSKPNL